MELVSIIIPHYNSSGFLEETLESIFNQTYTNLEVIIVDDGSDFSEWDKLNKIKNKWGDIQVYKRPSYLIKGANSCRNYGLSLAKGQFVNFVDADDLLLPEKIEKQVLVFRKNYILDMVVCKTRYFRTNVTNLEDNVQKVEFEDTSDFLKLYLSRVGVWCTNSALIKRTSIGEVKFKEGQVDAHEWLFFLLLMLNDKKVSATNEILVHKRKHPGSIGRMELKYKLPSLLESRKIIYNSLKNYNHPNKFVYQKLLLNDINSLLKSTAKNGNYLLFMKYLLYFDLNIIEIIRANFIYLIFLVFKKGDSIKIINK